MSLAISRCALLYAFRDSYRPQCFRRFATPGDTAVLGQVPHRAARKEHSKANRFILAGRIRDHLDVCGLWPAVLNIDRVFNSLALFGRFGPIQPTPPACEKPWAIPQSASATKELMAQDPWLPDEGKLKSLPTLPQEPSQSPADNRAI